MLWGKRNSLGVTFGLLLILVCAHGRLIAYDGDMIYLPRGGLPAVSGLTLSVDARWVTGYGMRPVRVRFSTFDNAPSSVERRLVVELGVTEEHFVGWGGREQLLRVRQEVVLPAGAASVEQIISVPHYAQWTKMSVGVWEGNRELRELQGSLTGFLNSQQPGFPYSSGADLPCALVIDQDMSRSSALNAPNSRQLFNVATWTEPLNRAGRARLKVQEGTAFFGKPSGDHPGDHVVLTTVKDDPGTMLLSPADLPDRWIDLTCADVAITSWDELNQLVAQYPVKFEALRRWVMSGRLLVVGGLEDPERRAWLARMMGGTLEEGALDSEGRWERLTTLRSDLLPELAERFRLRSTILLPPDPAQVGVTQQQTSPPTTSQRTTTGVWLARFGIGVVAAIGSEDPCQDAPEFWGALNAAPRHTVAFGYRIAGEVSTGVFTWDAGIPGVGKPPVVSFLVLITLFVAVIGPINYVMLWRLRKLYLLLLTIPAGAALVTLAIIGYAIIADGLGVHARVRSISIISPDGIAVTWSHQSYYASMAGSRGLRFSESAWVMPVIAPDYFRGTKDVLWRSGQVWRGAYFQSRELLPVNVVEVDRYPISVEYDGHRIRNRLGGTALVVYMQDEDGKWWQATNVASGQEANLQPVEPEAVKNSLRSKFAARLEKIYLLPVRARAMYARPLRTSGDLFTILFKEVAELQPLPARPFIALLEDAAWYPLGTRPVQETDSLRVVLGSWRSSSAGQENMSIDPVDRTRR